MEIYTESYQLANVGFKLSAVTPFEIRFLDVGHGECAVLKTSDPQTVCLIDSGSSSPNEQASATNFVRTAIANRKTDLVLSHYHWDHFSLYQAIGSPRLNRLFVPAIPFLSARESLSTFFAIAEIASYGYYRFLPTAIMNAKEVIAAHTNSGLPILGLEGDVLWPDYSFGLPIIERRIAKLGENMQRILGQARESLSESDREYFEQLLAYLSKAMSEGTLERSRGRLPERESGPPKNVEALRTSLEKSEYAVKEIADYFSLVFNLLVARNKNFALFLGDCPNRVLDSLSPVTGPYALIKGAHHGTRFGSCLDDVETTIEFFSRSSRTRPIHHGYLDSVTFQMLHSTQLHGDLSVKCS